MHDALKQRLIRRIESLPEEQVYQALDYIEFLEAKYAERIVDEATGLQRFAEKLEDRLRRRTVSPANIREAFQLISAADRVLSNVSSAGKQLLAELNGPDEERPPGGERPERTVAAGAPRTPGDGSASRG
jgi:vacuolar-type H+-ATPase subunit E/Vma4